MLNIYICDDNENDIIECKNMILTVLDKNDVNFSTFNSGESLLFNIEEQMNIVDVIFMDIEMKSINGINTVKSLRKQGYQGDVVYLTSISDYVFDSFETNPVNYLLKNDRNLNKLEKVLNVIVEHAKQRTKDSIVITKSNVQYKLKKKEIVFIESKGRKLYVHMENQEIYDCYMKLSEIMDELGKASFVRVHKSFVVNFIFIEQLKNKMIKLQNNIEIPIGRCYNKEIQDYIIKKLI